MFWYWSFSVLGFGLAAELLEVLPCCAQQWSSGSQMSGSIKGACSHSSAAVLVVRVARKAEASCLGKASETVKR